MTHLGYTEPMRPDAAWAAPGWNAAMAVPEEEFVGVTERLRAAMQARGFWNAERDGPAIARFCRTYPQFDARYMALWVNLRVKRRPSLRTLRQLADVLGVSVSYLLLGPSIYEDQEWTRILAHRRTGHPNPKKEAISK